MIASGPARTAGRCRRLGSGFAKASARLAAGRSSGPIYVSAKRTQFIFAVFSMYHFCLQKLMPFAAAFANGFVSEKRTQIQVCLVGFSAAETTLRWETNPSPRTSGINKASNGQARERRQDT